MLAQHSSETSEHYSPAKVVEPARKTLVRIDLDPASSYLANTIVQAIRWEGWNPDDPNDDPRRMLARSWGASDAPSRVFLNPPGGKLDAATLLPLPRNAKGVQAGPGLSSAAVWWSKLLVEWQLGNVEQAIFVCFSLAVFRTSQAGELAQLPPYAFPMVVPVDRINYDRVDWCNGRAVRVATKGAPADSAIIYLPERIEHSADGDWSYDGLDRFRTAFKHLGHVATQR